MVAKDASNKMWQCFYSSYYNGKRFDFNLKNIIAVSQ